MKEFLVYRKSGEEGYSLVDEITAKDREDAMDKVSRRENIDYDELYAKISQREQIDDNRQNVIDALKRARQNGIPYRGDKWVVRKEAPHPLEDEYWHRSYSSWEMYNIYAQNGSEDYVVFRYSPIGGPTKYEIYRDSDYHR